MLKLKNHLRIKNLPALKKYLAAREKAMKEGEVWEMMDDGLGNVNYRNVKVSHSAYGCLGQCRRPAHMLAVWVNCRLVQR